ncbi:hypothetical protein F2P81_020484 [Scophthalmus maximus]|uniref:Major facilitator superfamily (MFS) profile domain-containing protein n=1 Tax=Scophthalmus maximus TaxID=52904 RepID=A0A6A4S043_SCOMX|nr:hypothetical protein F2P81_020484 [Scophthalmus maximus]
MAEEVLIPSSGKITASEGGFPRVDIPGGKGSKLKSTQIGLRTESDAEKPRFSKYIKDFYNKTVVSRNGTGLSADTLTLMYSLTVSVFAIGGLLGSLVVGMLVTRFGSRPDESNVCVYVSTVLLQEEHWPLFLSVVVVPTFIQLMLLPWFPESPRYLLMEKHNVHATITALKWYRAKCNIQAEIEEMQEEQRSLSSVETLSVWKLLRDDTVRWQVLSVAVVNIGMQLSGIDAIWFYTNDIFENAGIPTPEIQYTTAGTGIIEIIAGVIGCVFYFIRRHLTRAPPLLLLQCFTIEKLGRRPLMVGGFAMMGICSAGITLSLILQVHLLFMRYISVGCVVGIIAGFCIAGVPFLVTAELFKQSHRPAAYIVGGSLNWVSNFTVGFVFPFLQVKATQ